MIKIKNKLCMLCGREPEPGHIFKLRLCEKLSFRTCGPCWASTLRWEAWKFAAVAELEAGS